MAEFRQNKYNKENTRAYTFRLNLNTDKELIECLEKQKSKSGFLKEALKKEIEKNKSSVK